MSDLQTKNKRTLVAVLLAIVFMLGLSFAAVPLYSIFCQVTGFGGTTQVAEVNPDQVYDRTMIVKFNTDISPNLSWSFWPEIKETTVKVGQDSLVSFLAKNLSDQSVVGTAVYNVTPLKVGKYFIKTQCFCFTEQLLSPGQEMHMPVSFFIDPSIMDDDRMDDIKTITLSYTFYPAQSSDLDKAQKKVYNDLEKINSY